MTQWVVKMTLLRGLKLLSTGVNPKEVKMTLLKGSPWGKENDSFKGVKMTLLNYQCIVLTGDWQSVLSKGVSVIARPTQTAC